MLYSISSNNRINELDADSGALLQSFVPPQPIQGGGGNGLAASDTVVYYTTIETSTVYVLDPSSGAVVSSFAHPGTVDAPGYGMTSFAATLFALSYPTDQVYLLNATTGAVFTSYTVGFDAIGGIDFDSATNSLFVSDPVGVVRRLNPTTGAVLGSISTGTFQYGLGILDGRLFTSTSDGIITRARSRHGAILGSYTSPGGYASALAGVDTVSGPAPPTPSTGMDFFSFGLAAGESASLVARSLTAGSISLTLQDASGTVLTSGAGGAINLDQSIQNFVAPVAGTYYAVITGASVTQYNLVVTRGAAFEKEPNNSLATAQDISGTLGALGAFGGGVTLPGGSGTPVTGPIDLVGAPLSLGIAPDGSFVGSTIGARLGAVEYLRFGTFLAGFTVSLNGTNYTNSSAGGPGTAFPVTMADLSTGTSHAIRITGNITPDVLFERFISWNDGDSYALVTTTLTNNGVTSINNAAILDNQDPDPSGVFTTSNDVALGGELVWGSAAAGAMGLGSADARAVVSAEGFTVTDPFAVINSPDDPNGSSGDIAINIAFSLGTLTPGQSTITTYAMVFGTTSGAVETVYSAVAPLTQGGAASDDDWYVLSVLAGDSLVLQTSTPGDGPGEFVNTLDPRLELYDPSGALVASGVALADGRNEVVNHVALGSGQYRVRVSHDADTSGEYVLSVSGATAPLPAFEVAAVTPGDGSVFLSAPTQVTVDFNDNVLLSSLQAGDLTVNGTPATGLTVVDGNTAIFTIPAVGNGTHTIAIAAGAVQDLQQTSLSAFSSTFSVDQTPPRVISSSIQQNDVVAAGNLTYVVTFDELMAVANLDNSDFVLFGIDRNVTYTPTGASYDATGRTLTINYSNLPEDRYTLTLLSGTGQFEDSVGIDLDGEPLAFPLPPNVSGDGIAGGNFSVDFTLDNVLTPYPVPLIAKQPVGSLVYDPAITSTIGFTGDTDSFTIDLDAGQAITVVVDPVAGLRPTIELRDPANAILSSVTAAADGQDAVLQTIPAATAGTYTIAVSGAAGTTGTFSLQVVLNAAVEAESHNGSANDSRATAQNIDGSFINLGSGIQRGAVLGDSPTPIGLPLITEGFESGSLGSAWSTSSSTTGGRIQVTSGLGVAGGVYALWMDCTSSTLTLNEAIWTVNLAGVSSPTLVFSHADAGDEETFFGSDFTGHFSADGVAISSDGVNWHPIWNASNVSSGVWQQFSFDLSAEAAEAGMTLGPNFRIKFQQVDEFSFGTDGRGWDNIAITIPQAPLGLLLVHVRSWGDGVLGGEVIDIGHGEFVVAGCGGQRAGDWDDWRGELRSGHPELRGAYGRHLLRGRDGRVGHAVQPGGDPRGSLRTGGQRQRSDGPGHFPHEPGVGILEFERSGPAVWLRRGEPVDQGDGSAHGGHDPQLCLARGGRLRLGLRHGDDSQLAAGGRTCHLAAVRAQSEYRRR